MPVGRAVAPGGIVFTKDLPSGNVVLLFWGGITDYINVCKNTFLPSFPLRKLNHISNDWEGE